MLEKELWSHVKFLWVGVWVGLSLMFVLTVFVSPPKVAHLMPVVALEPTFLDRGDVEPSGTFVDLPNGETFETVELVSGHTLSEETPEDVVTGEVELFGFTNDDVDGAQQFVSSLLVTDFIDNPALTENVEAFDQWVEVVVERGTYDENLLPPEGSGFTLTHNDETIIPEIISDGDARVADASIVLTNVTASEYENIPHLIFGYETSTKYRVSDAAILDATLAASGLTNVNDLQEELKDKVFDSVGENIFVINNTIEFTVQEKDNGWMVVEVAPQYVFDDSDYRKVS